MKRLIYSLLTISVCIFALGCPAASSQTVRETVKDELPAFRKIILGGDFQLELRYGKQYRAAVEAEELLADYVLFSVAENTLSVSLDERKIPTEVKRMFRGRNATTPTFRVTVTMPESLSALRLEDRASLVSAEDLVADPDGIEISVVDNAVVKAFTFSASRVSVTMERKGEATMDVRCDSLDVQMSGNSRLTVTQHAGKASYALAFNANLQAGGEAERLFVNGKAASKAILNGRAATVSYKLINAANVNAVNLAAEEARVEMSGLCALTEAATGDLYVDLSSGASLTFLNDPRIHIVRVKGASFLPYDTK